MSASLQGAELALARGRTAALLGRLLLDGFGLEAMPMVRALPALAEALPEVSEDELAARHHGVLIRGVPPFESLFLGDKATLGGAAAGQAAATWAAIGMKVVRHDIEADHFGLSLRALGLLCAAEHDALRDGVAVDRLHALQGQVLRDRLLPAWAPFQVAVQREDRSEWSAVVGLAGALIDGLAQQIGVSAAPPPSPEPVDDLVTTLLTPSRSGWWLSGSAVRRIGAALGHPVGFGGRRTTFKNLVESSAAHGELAPLRHALEAELHLWREGLRHAPGGDAWMGRLVGATQVVEGLWKG